MEDGLVTGGNEVGELSVVSKDVWCFLAQELEGDKWWLF